MTYGNTYVAAVSNKLDNTQLLHTLSAASHFPGPSVVTAPQVTDMLASMVKVEGAEPPVHYKWDPTCPHGQRLDVAPECKNVVIDPEFLKGEENLSMLLAQLDDEFETSVESKLQKALSERVAEVNRVDENKVVTVLFGSESPSKAAKYIADTFCAKLKGSGYYIETGGPLPLDVLTSHDRITEGLGDPEAVRKKVVLLISTAGVGEFPDGSKGFAKEVFPAKIEKQYEGESLSIHKDALDLSLVDYAVFGLGDTNYHPAEKHHEDKFGQPWTFCTPAKIAKRVFDDCGASQICDIGFGDDSEMGGFNAGFERWLPGLFENMGGSDVPEVAPSSSSVKKVEDKVPKYDGGEYIKLGSHALKQPLLNDLMDPTNDRNVQAASALLIKHHGVYQQCLRDHDIITDEQKRNPFSFMVRVRLPGGDCTPAQMKGMLDICNELGNGTVKITTRQTFQLHGIQKRGLIESINQMNKHAMDTIAACGDVNRNVMSTAVRYPTMDQRDPNLVRFERTVAQCNEIAKGISTQLLPEGLCNTYHEIWVNRGRPNNTDEEFKKASKVYVKGNALKYRADGTVDFAHEPVLKQRYLPRKFKIAISVPPFNDTDCFAHDIGLIAISDSSGDVIGFNLCIGGGLGATRHGLTKAYPRLGDIVGFMSRGDEGNVCQKILEIQRDYGYRTDRTHSRLKYTVEDKGADFFVSEINRRMSEDEDMRMHYPRGFRLAAAVPFEFKDNKDRFGESITSDGRHNFTLYMQNGRIKNYEAGAELNGTGAYWANKQSHAMQLKEMVYQLCELGIRHTHAGGGDDGSHLNQSFPPGGWQHGSHPYHHQQVPFTFVLTNNQNLVVANVVPSLRREVVAILKDHHMPIELSDDTTTHSLLLKNAMACVALPTCGLAMAPSETYLPELLIKIEAVMDELDFPDAFKDIIVRMSGCPNGCSRMVLGEICFVGRSMEVGSDGVPKGIYDMSIGGNETGTRLATMYKKGLSEAAIIAELRPMLKEYKVHKQTRPTLRFGGFCIERGWVRECKAQPTLGKAGHPGTGAREPAITYHMSVTYAEEMKEEIAQLADANVDKLGDVLKQHYGVHDVRSIDW